VLIFARWLRDIASKWFMLLVANIEMIIRLDVALRRMTRGILVFLPHCGSLQCFLQLTFGISGRRQPVRCMPWLGCSSIRSDTLDGPVKLSNGRPKRRKVAGWYPGARERHSSSPAIGVHLITLAQAPKRGALRRLVVLTASSPGHARAQ
jgi:hypothetical protein